MKLYSLTEKQHLLDNSKAFMVKPNQKYQIEVDIKAYSGRPGSIYFSVIILDSSKKEIDRKRKWITDFNGKQEKHSIVFSTLNADSVVVGYRINVETPFVSPVKIEIQNIDSVSLKKVDNNLQESFDEFTPLNANELKPLTQDQENILESNLVWIFGSIRSGSTWLGTQLLKHESHVIWPEPYIGWHLDSIRDWHYGNEDRYFFSHYHKNNWLQPLRKLILARAHSQAQSISKKLIIKEPNGSGASNIIMECFPNSKLIFLIRDGRDVVDSIMDAHEPNSWNKDNPITKFEPLKNYDMRWAAIENHSKEWKRIIEAIWTSYLKHKKELKLIVKYEDLLVNTKNELKKIYQFLGKDGNDEFIQLAVEKYSFENIPGSQKGKAKFFRRAEPGAWKENFNEKEKDLMNSIMGSTLKNFDY